MINVFIMLIIVFVTQGIDDIDMEEDKREIINREIRSFRDLHKVGKIIGYKFVSI